MNRMQDGRNRVAVGGILGIVTQGSRWRGNPGLRLQTCLLPQRGCVSPKRSAHPTQSHAYERAPALRLGNLFSDDVLPDSRCIP